MSAEIKLRQALECACLAALRAGISIEEIEELLADQQKRLRDSIPYLSAALDAQRGPL